MEAEKRLKEWLFWVGIMNLLFLFSVAFVLVSFRFHCCTCLSPPPHGTCMRTLCTAAPGRQAQAARGSPQGLRVPGLTVTLLPSSSGSVSPSRSGVSVISAPNPPPHTPSLLSLPHSGSHQCPCQPARLAQGCGSHTSITTSGFKNINWLPGYSGSVKTQAAPAWCLPMRW